VAGLRISRAPDLVVLAAVGCVALLLSALLIKAPLVAAVAVGVLLLVAAFGMEGLISVCLLGAFGLLPFVGADDFLTGNLKTYAILFLAAVGAMLVTYSSRIIAHKPRWPLPVNALSVGLVVLLAYVTLVALSSNPKEVPALTTPFFVLPLAGLATLLWLSHEDALAGMRRALPLIVAIVAAWALAYDAGSAGCGPCREWVSTGLTNDGLLGSDSRLYTEGQNSFLALFLIAAAYALARPGGLSLTLVGIGALTIALQASRAQYIAVLAGVGLLLIWKLGQLRVGGRVALVAISALTFLALASSPVGDRAASAYTDLQQNTGTGAYRIELIERTSDSWTVLGQGFSTETLELGFDVDLGLPNTLLILGYVGALIQLALIGFGIWRGVAARTLVGTTVAAILIMVLVARPTLPLLEYGHSAVMYGAMLGVAAVLGVSRSRRAESRASPR
jgi:hypothetical protein